MFLKPAGSTQLSSSLRAGPVLENAHLLYLRVIFKAYTVQRECAMVSR